MSDGLPTSLTVLRPISFGQGMRGPDGQILSTLPNAPADEPTQQTDDIELGQLRSPTAALRAPASPLTPTNARAHKPRPTRDERQMRAAEAAQAGSAGGQVKGAGAAMLDDVTGIEIHDDEHAHSGHGHSSDEEEDGAGIGFSSAELAGGRSAAGGPRSHDQRTGKTATHHHHHHPHHDGSLEHDEHKQHQHHHHVIAMHLPADAVAPPAASEAGQFAQHFDGHSSNVAAYPHSTPSTAASTRTILLDASNLPESTVPPLSRMKLQTFDELREAQRIKLRGIQALGGMVFVSAKRKRAAARVATVNEREELTINAIVFCSFSRRWASSPWSPAVSRSKPLSLRPVWASLV